MRIDVLDYYTKEDWLLIRQEAKCHPSPFLVVNLNIVKRKYEELLAHFPFAKIYYAVKANPAPEVIELLRDLGSHFDIASRYELDRVLSLGVTPDRISYGNTIKKVADIRYFYEKGVSLYATDSERATPSASTYWTNRKAFRDVQDAIPAFRHSRRSNMLMADGHVESYSRGEIPTMGNIRTDDYFFIARGN